MIIVDAKKIDRANVRQNVAQTTELINAKSKIEVSLLIEFIFNKFLTNTFGSCTQVLS